MQKEASHMHYLWEFTAESDKFQANPYLIRFR